MRVPFRKLCADAVTPTKAHPSDAGFDLTAVSVDYEADGNFVCHTGLAFAIPEGYMGLVFPRSSVSKKDLIMSNCVGVIDAHYRGEVTAKFAPYMKASHTVLDGYRKGDRVAQLIILPLPEIEFEEIERLSATDRGEGGYGSTGD